MPRAWLGVGSLAVITGLAVLFWFHLGAKDEPALFEPVVSQIEPAPLCPWREPGQDLEFFFPGSGAEYVSEKRTLSGLRVELAEQLGRLPEAHEHTLIVHHVRSEAGQEVGRVMTGRVKGEYGAIELVLATTPGGEVQGVRIQRMREPEAVASHLSNVDWLSSFRGRRHDSGWDPNDVGALPEVSRPSAQAIVEGMRTLLVLQAASAHLSTNGQAHH